MEPERLNDLVSWPLLVPGIVLTLVGVSPLLAVAAIMAGLTEKPEAMQIGGMLLSAAFFLATGLPALFSFLLRRKVSSRKLARVAGGILLLYALAFPFTLAINVPFFIPLFFYVNGATGIWALLRSR